jgi:hypothetical protein
MENQSKSVFDNGGIVNQMDIQSNTKHQFNLNAFNACCIHVHKAKIFNECAIPCSRYPWNSLGSISYLLKLGKILHSPNKP